MRPDGRRLATRECRGRRQDRDASRRPDGGASRVLGRYGRREIRRDGVADPDHRILQQQRGAGPGRLRAGDARCSWPDAGREPDPRP